MDKIQFSHANGFGAKTYTHFLKQLEPHTINAVQLIGHGKHKLTKDWKSLVPELIESIEANHTEPVVGLGHSLGAAITFLAAIQRPDLFKQIILIEPPIFGFRARMMIGLMSLFGLNKNIPIAKKTKNRRQEFDSKEMAYDYFQGKRLFKTFDKQCFEDYINYGLKESATSGVELAFSRDIEYKVFTTTPIFLGDTTLKVPHAFIYSNQYKTLQRNDINWWKSSFKNMEFHEFDGGHLFPLEKPKAAAQLIKQIIARQ